MNKIKLTMKDIKILDLIYTLQIKINKIVYVDISFDERMRKYFNDIMQSLDEIEKNGLRLTLFKLEELNLISGDVLHSPRITSEGIKKLNYYKRKDKTIKCFFGTLLIASIITLIKKTNARR